MIDREQLNNLFAEYGYTLKEQNDSCCVYLLQQGMYYGAEIVIFDGTEQNELYQSYLDIGYSVKRQNFKSIEEVEEYLFRGFFKTDTLDIEIRHRYNAFVERQVRPYGINTGIVYRYIPMPFIVYKGISDEGKSGEDLLKLVFEQITRPGAHLVIIEAAAGYGKTCTSYEIFNRFINRESTKSIKPIFTELSRNRDAKQFKYVLWSEIDKEKTTIAKQKLVVYNIRKGRIPLIVDGFDELLSKDIDSGGIEGLDEFEQVETMLSTIGGLLTENAKIILTSRKTAIFAGNQFEQWMEKFNGAFDVIRIQLEKPDIRSWLSDERYEALKSARVPLTHVSNPVILTYLRNIPIADFDEVLKGPVDITTKYLESLLNREQDRQNITISVGDQQIIFENLALSFLELDIMGESRQFIKDLIVEKNKQMLLYYKELSVNNLTLSELLNTLTNHALLDRLGNKDFVTFINEYIFGYLLGQALLKRSDDILQQHIPFSENIFERVLASFKYADASKRNELWNTLMPFRSKMSKEFTLSFDCVLVQRLYSTFENHVFNSLNFENVVFDTEEECFFNVSFVGCIFEKCEFSPFAFKNTFFTGCKFLDCTLKQELTSTDCSRMFFYGCEDYDSGFLSKFDTQYEVKISQEDEQSLEMRILSMYFKVDRRSTRTKYVSYIKDEFPEEQLEEVFCVFHTLRKKDYIHVEGNNSSITQQGINYYHHHTSQQF